MTCATTMKHIEQMKFEVSSACQNDCELCAHGDLRREFKGYQLSMEQLQRFVTYTKESGYYIGSVLIHGPGEPLLWRHLNEGLALLNNSGIIGAIQIQTNGLGLERITEKAWKYIDKMQITLYSNFNQQKILTDVLTKHGHKISLHKAEVFMDTLEPLRDGAPIPCRCACKGPMLIGDWLFLFCGPPVFGAASSMGKNIFDYPELYSNVDMNYLEQYDKSRIGNHGLCQHCWANLNFTRERKVHRHVGGGYS